MGMATADEGGKDLGGRFPLAMRELRVPDFWISPAVCAPTTNREKQGAEERGIGIRWKVRRLVPSSCSSKYSHQPRMLYL
jgi:hypothetical protein